MLLRAASISQIKVQKNPQFLFFAHPEFFLLFCVPCRVTGENSPAARLECRQLSSVAADLEPDTRWGISQLVLVCAGCWRMGQKAPPPHTQRPCPRPTRRLLVASAPCLKTLPSCRFFTRLFPDSDDKGAGEQLFFCGGARNLLSDTSPALVFNTHSFGQRVWWQMKGKSFTYHCLFGVLEATWQPKKWNNLK